MSPEQLTFDLSQRPAFGREDFLVSQSNQEAVALVDRWPNWPSHALCLIGPSGSGKTHLAHVWMEVSHAPMVVGSDLNEEALKRLLDASAVIVEDADRGVDEEALFHLYNALARKGGALFLTGATPPAKWHVQLPDLKSRLATIAIAELQSPDDTLLAGLLVKQKQCWAQIRYHGLMGAVPYMCAPRRAAWIAWWVSCGAPGSPCARIQRSSSVLSTSLTAEKAGSAARLVIS